MNEFFKRFATESTNGRGKKIVAVASPGTLLHTATNVAGEKDEIWLWLVNSIGSAVVSTTQLGGTTSPDDEIKYTVQPQDGLKCVLPGLCLAGGLELRVFASAANVLVAHLYINRIAEA